VIPFLDLLQSFIAQLVHAVVDFVVGLLFIDDLADRLACDELPNLHLLRSTGLIGYEILTISVLSKGNFLRRHRHG
jgi:hypothetical protein